MPSGPTPTVFVIGAGSVFSISTDGGTTFTPVNQLKTASFSGGKVDFDDVSNMSSPSSFHEYAPTMLDAGNCSLQGVFDPHDAGQVELAAAFNAKTLLSCKLVYATMAGDSTGFTRAFTGYVSDHNLDAQFDKSSTLSATLKITGPITDTAPTSGS